jgi:hypothetical protein
LQIEIDQLKSQQQIAEVTDNAFFQDLKQKAALIRSERHNATQG